MDFSPYHSHLPRVIIHGFLPRLRACRYGHRGDVSGVLRSPCPKFSHLIFLNPDMGFFFSKSPHPDLFLKNLLCLFSMKIFRTFF